MKLKQKKEEIIHEKHLWQVLLRLVPYVIRDLLNGEEANIIITWKNYDKK